MNRLTLVYLSALPLLFFACNPERVKYTSELKQEIADSKIKRVTNADVVETVNVFGEKISTVVQKELEAKLRETSGPTEQATFCQLRNMPRTKAISERYGLTIRLLGAADVQDKTLDPKERELLGAYQYNAEQKLSQISNIQKINDTLFIYNAAVPTTSTICKACFGNQQTPFAVWRLAFSKRQVVRRMADTKKKKKTAY